MERKVTPLMIMSDAPTSGTGLGRITRDLAIRIAANLSDVFRVCTFGYGGSYSKRLHFPQYSMDMSEWVTFNLPEVWNDFSEEEPGAILWIWDSSRALWFARPENCPDPRLRTFLLSGKFRKWCYLPIDATGPHNKLTAVLKHTIEPFDRVLAYSAWAEGILTRTGIKNVCHLPHGIDTTVFFPRPRTAARHGFGERIGLKTMKGKWFNIPDDAFLIGIVATNQVRKDWGLGISTIAEIAKDRNVLIWCHIDTLEKHWSLPALLTDFGLASKAAITVLPLTDEQMAWCYTACDLTLGIGNGEGFGYPIFESLACGTPCIHGNDGGAPEHMPLSMLVNPIGQRLESPYNCKRNVYDPVEWANAALGLLGVKDGHSLLPFDLDWNNLWPRWAEWLKAGIQ